jgi:ATP-dependent DNA ligase
MSAARLLEDEIIGRDLIHPARRLPDHGLEAWTMVKQQGWEGMVAKDPTAPYQAAPPGAGSR